MTTHRRVGPRGIELHRGESESHLLGRRIVTLARGPHAAGEHTATLRADGLASGVYVLQVRIGESSVTQRIVVAR